MPINWYKWHIVIRFRETDSNDDNTNLGDRSLTLFINLFNNNNVYFHFTTYSTISGNVNIYTNSPGINYIKINNKWIFIYYAYSENL